MGAANVKLSESDRRELEARITQIGVVGDRYTPEMMALVHR
jgi:hypothetical protein